MVEGVIAGFIVVLAFIAGVLCGLFWHGKL